ncbi:pseudouridylate synthase RPUSD2-like isoform X1 [Dermacentor variabilis]|uniref:pseudouridylate synthase RPUSD2-like isoform X1 n=1 Tax=Dermacentor variabilis TaxID=34621 RepID=UPI003F5B3D16
MLVIAVLRTIFSKVYNIRNFVSAVMSTALNESPRDIVEESDTGCGVKRKAEEPVTGLDIKKIRQGQKELRPGFGSDRFDETEYYFQHGLRKVYPYYFTYTTFCKGRWVGHLLVDVFTREFRAHSREVYENAIKAGLVTVNNKVVGTDYRLKDNDLLANTLHRHEVPVLGAPIKILHNADDMIVVDKPPSVPVHPCGRYRHNSVIFILAKEHGLQNLHTVHRLDRLTSGLLLMSRSVDRARELENEIKGRLVAKEYLCRVEGCFPDDTVTCCEPIEVISHKIGVCGVSAHGKECKTEFKRLSYNGKSSVVLCKPFTGRMHQIRVHLQYLGYPIVNDPLYNHTVFGSQKAKGGLTEKTKEQLVEDLLEVHNLKKWLGPEMDLTSDGCLPEDEGCGGGGDTMGRCEFLEKPATSHFPESLNHYLEGAESLTFRAMMEKQAFDKAKFVRRQECLECRCKYKDPEPKDLLIYLHCLRYKGSNWVYEAAWPSWARENWTDD